MVSKAYRLGLPSTFPTGANRFIVTTGIRLIFYVQKLNILF